MFKVIKIEKCDGLLAIIKYFFNESKQRYTHAGKYALAFEKGNCTIINLYGVLVSFRHYSKCFIFLN